MAGRVVSAVDCLKQQSGDSRAKSRLLAALCRNRGIAAGPLPVAEGRLDETILAAVEADEGRPTARPQAVGQHAQQLFEVGQLAVDEDTQGLKGAGGGMQVPAAGRRPSATPAGRSS